VLFAGKLDYGSKKVRSPYFTSPNAFLGDLGVSAVK